MKRRFVAGGNEILFLPVVGRHVMAQNRHNFP
jgi:hypothetical protein